MALTSFMGTANVLDALDTGAGGALGAVLPGIVSTLAATLLMTGVFAYLAKTAPSRALTLWTLAWAAAVARRLAELIAVLAGRSAVLDGLFDLATILTCLLLLAGTLTFYGRRLHPGWWLGGTLALAALTVGRALGASFLAVHLAPFLFLALVLVINGWLLLRASEPPGVGRLVAGWGLVLWGLHVADYPILRTIPEVAPWGFLLTAVLQIGIAVGFLILHFERVRDALDASERRFRALFQNSIDGMFRARPDGRFEDVNPALVELLGAPDAATVLREHRLADLLPVGVGPTSNPPLLALDPSLRPRVSHLRPDGNAVELDVTSWTVRDEQGHLSWFEGVVRDVTREQAIQARLFQARKLEAIGQLAGGVAHDFNNLLTVIGGCNALFANADPEERRELQADIAIATERAADLTHKLLVFSRRRASEARRVDLVPVVAQIASMLHRLIGEDVTLELQLPDEPCRVDAEVLLIEQSLLNLAVNARDAMPGGGKLTIQLALEERTVVLSVTDDGVGIAPEALPHIFEPFFTTKDVGAGTGLGLATVYGAVGQLGGTIDVTSEVGVGTTFVVRLPACDDAPTDEVAAVVGPAIQRRARVLLVEDEDAVRRLAERLLKEAGHDVVACVDGLAAWEAFEADPIEFDVVVTDVVMPRLSGVGLAARLRAVRPALPVVFVTGYPERSQPPDSEHFRGTHVQKPFSREELIDAVGRALAGTVGGGDEPDPPAAD